MYCIGGQEDLVSQRIEDALDANPVTVHASQCMRASGSAHCGPEITCFGMPPMSSPAADGNQAAKLTVLRTAAEEFHLPGITERNLRIGCRTLRTLVHGCRISCLASAVGRHVPP